MALSFDHWRFIGGFTLYSFAARSAAETIRLGEALGSLLQPGDLIALDGDLGAGKTCLAGGIGRGLQVKERVKSPSFTLVNEYQGQLPLYHMDVYRLDNPSEVNDLGFDEYFYGAGAVLVEWAQKILDFLPEQRLDIIIDKQQDDENARDIKLIPHGSRYEHLVRELIAHVHAGD